MAAPTPSVAGWSSSARNTWSSAATTPSTVTPAWSPSSAPSRPSRRRPWTRHGAGPSTRVTHGGCSVSEPGPDPGPGPDAGAKRARGETAREGFAFLDYEGSEEHDRAHPPTPHRPEDRRPGRARRPARRDGRPAGLRSLLRTPGGEQVPARAAAPERPAARRQPAGVHRPGPAPHHHAGGGHGQQPEALVQPRPGRLLRSAGTGGVKPAATAELPRAAALHRGRAGRRQADHHRHHGHRPGPAGGGGRPRPPGAPAEAGRRS